MSVQAYVGEDIAFDYRATGEVLCKNPKGLVFFLRAEPPAPARPAVPPPAPRAWQAVEATQEVEVKRHAEPQALAEATRTVPQAVPPAVAPAAAFKSVEATQEVEVRREPAPQPVRGTSPLAGAPAPGKQPEKGWLGKLFGK